jgi:hypothetical protein
MVSSFKDDVMGMVRMLETDLFMITSVINTGNIPWSYSTVRSAFSIEERFKQTLCTIQSIRDKAPNSLILLVECSELSAEMEDILKNNVDYYLQCYTMEHVRTACIQNGLKGYGEAMKTREAVRYLVEHCIPFQRLFKISGRYYLNESFSKMNYAMNDYSFKMYDDESGSTVLYSVSYSLLDHFTNALEEIITMYQTHGACGYETLLPASCHPKKLIETLGVCGYVAIPNSTTGQPELYES